ncbi:hypothetical protein RJ639_028952 [Escallonia herrerae]|uniref:Trichome birefringence-like N-terminal domain-containing protein n=1 Tax=Escallonia herrerae TaxID=1293975 RepID=A0AA88X5V5_9ASTE|nr:hypothetical protein RJ639_028952 [Escallonia herrerae]
MDQIVRQTPFLLCSVGVSTLFYLHFIYSPGPPRLASHDVPDHNVLAQQQKDGEKCDLYKGHWVRDFNGSLYTNFSCTTIPKSKDCFKNGRRDRDFLNWRWKPDRCELPRFNPKTFFQIVRGKKMAFIGDSVAQNHMHSLLCLLSKEETPVPLLQPNDSKNRIIDFNDSLKSSQTWHFPSHDFTVMGLRSNFLVKAEERSAIHGSDSFIYDLNLDKVDDIWAQKLPSLDYAIFSGGHWFFRPNFLYQGYEIL